MNLTLKQYLTAATPPKLSYHVKYSELFEVQYNRLRSELLAFYSEEKGINFFCWRSEGAQFLELSKQGKLRYRDNIVCPDTNPEFLEEYSEYFKQGFDSINDQTPPNVILNHVPVCFLDRCLCVEAKGPESKTVKIGRRVADTRPCIAGRRPFSFDSFFDQGILRFQSINYETDVRILARPDQVAFNDGAMFKSIFQVIERYSEFEKVIRDSANRIIDNPSRAIISNMTDDQKIHQMLEFMLRTNPNKFDWTPLELMPAFADAISEHEIQYLCQILIDNNDVSDNRTKDGFSVGFIDRTRNAFHGKKYLKTNKAPNFHINQVQNISGSIINSGVSQSLNYEGLRKTVNHSESQTEPLKKKLSSNLFFPILVAIITIIITIILKYGFDITF